MLLQGEGAPLASRGDVALDRGNARAEGADVLELGITFSKASPNFLLSSSDYPFVLLQCSIAQYRCKLLYVRAPSSAAMASSCMVGRT